MNQAGEVTHAEAPPSRKRLRRLLIAGSVILGLAIISRIGLDTWPIFNSWLERERLAFQFKSDDPTVADQAATKLMNLGREGQITLLEVVHHSSDSARLRACRYIPKLSLDSTKIVGALSDALSDPNDLVRLEAALGFGPHYQVAIWADRDASLGPVAINSLSALLDDEPQIQIAAANALAMFGPHASSASEPLTALLKNSDQQIRTAAACALIRIDRPKNLEAGNTLIDSLTKPDPGTLTFDVISLASSLHIAGPDLQNRALIALKELLLSDNSGVRSFALSVLEEMKEDARRLVPTMEELVKKLATLAGKSMINAPGGTEPGHVTDANLDTRCDVASVLVTIDGKANFLGVAALLDTIVEPTVGTAKRRQAVTILERHDSKSLRFAVPILLESIDDPDPATRDLAREFLKRIDPKANADAMKKSSHPQM